MRWFDPSQLHQERAQVANCSYKATADANNRRKKQVIATNHSGQRIVFDSISETSRKLNVGRRHVQAVLKGNRSHAGGYKFQYLDEEVVL